MDINNSTFWGKLKVLMLKGEKGDAGVSPSVNVETITGGHKVNITDAEGTESFDVMDGSAGNYDTLTNKPQINGVELVGNNTSSDLNIVTEQIVDTKIQALADIVPTKAELDPEWIDISDKLYTGWTGVVKYKIVNNIAYFIGDIKGNSVSQGSGIIICYLPSDDFDLRTFFNGSSVIGGYASCNSEIAVNPIEVTINSGRETSRLVLKAINVSVSYTEYWEFFAIAPIVPY